MEIDITKRVHYRYTKTKKEICMCGGYGGSLEFCLCEKNQDCDFRQLQQLKQENEELKKQYNCYACGNCNGKEDYINLEKHHIGLRKQYDKYSQCLDEINKILQEYHPLFVNTPLYMIDKVIRQIKEVKGNEYYTKNSI